jgi:hypothetical protein
MSKTIFVGPYLECQFRIETVVEKQEIPGKLIPSSRYCPNKHSFKQSSLANYCPVCGHAMTIVPEKLIDAQTKELSTKKFTPTPDEVDEFCLVDELFQRTYGETAYCLEEKKGIRHYYVSEAGVKFQEFLIYDFDAEVIQKKLSDFKFKYEKQIAKFKRLFGEDNVSLKFGIIYYID